MALPERDQGSGDFCFVFHDQRIGLEYSLDNSGNFFLSEAVEAFQYPYCLCERNNANEPWRLLGQVVFHHDCGFARLHWVVLREVPNQNVGIETNHFRARARYLSVAPAAIASSISSRVARREDLTIPRNAETGSLGKRNTVPLGCTKNLTRSPGFTCRCSRIALGMVTWPLTVIADSILPPLLYLKCNTNQVGCKACGKLIVDIHESFLV